MVKVINVLTYGIIVIGLIFAIIAIILNVYKVVDPSGIYKYIYPYQTMSFRFLLSA
jgi:hypothetical protein